MSSSQSPISLLLLHQMPQGPGVVAHFVATTGSSLFGLMAIYQTIIDCSEGIGPNCVGHCPVGWVLETKKKAKQNKKKPNFYA